MNERRIFGPPGCGKTYSLTEETKNAALDHGADNIRIASFTRAAAENIAARTLGMRAEHIGTLHALCYRASKSKGVIDLRTKKTRDAWNLANPHLKFRDPSDMESASRGDKLMQEMELFRARMIPKEMWPPGALDFANRWDEFKSMVGLIDFTDMIEQALDTMDTAPGNPRVLVLDEAQDFSKLENALIDKWAAHCELVIKAGDDDQTIYEWKGADPEGFIEGDFEAHFLEQSYRVPATVQRCAEQWISMVKHRMPKTYKPRAEEGEVIPGSCSYKDPKRVLHVMEPYLEAGKSVMFLAYCEYMLGPLLGEMKKAGLPFHNPYATERGAGWNPLQSTNYGVSSAARLMDFLQLHIPLHGEDADFWRPYHLDRWLHAVETKGVLKRGAKQKIRELATDPQTMMSKLDVTALMEFFELEALNDAMLASDTGDLSWLKEHLLPSLKQRMTYPINVVEKAGARALVDTPQIIVGTIHSVKGGEADVVLLCPDLSPKGYENWRRDRDNVIRPFYVGMTRARESLILCRAAAQGPGVPRVPLRTAAQAAGVM